jgi:hypothetical protein
MDDFIFQKIKEHNTFLYQSRIIKNNELIRKCDNIHLLNFYNFENKLNEYYKIIYYKYDKLNKKSKKELPKKLEECFLEVLTKAEILAEINNEQNYLQKVKNLSDTYKLTKNLLIDGKVTENLRKKYILLINDEEFKNYLPTILLFNHNMNIFKN